MYNISNTLEQQLTLNTQFVPWSTTKALYHANSRFFNMMIYIAIRLPVVTQMFFSSLKPFGNNGLENTVLSTLKDIKTATNLSVNLAMTLN